jgi:hypothetical protein
MTEKALMSKAKAARDTDYSAVRRACSKVLTGEEGDLRAKLDNALKAGWTIQALKAYAFSVWRKPGCDYVTEAAWRLSVEFADSDGRSGGRDFLKRFNADPERYSLVKRHFVSGVRRPDGGEPH